MLLSVPLDAQDEEILGMVRKWLHLLAEERYEDAQNLLMPSERTFPQSGEHVQQIIETFDLSDPPGTHRVTSPDTAIIVEPRPPHHLVSFYHSPVGRANVVGDVYFELPIDGEWSGLTAVFEIVATAEGLALRLETLRILGVIELDDLSHASIHRQNRDAFLDGALRAAGVPIIRFRVGRTYSPPEVREQVVQSFGLASFEKAISQKQTLPLAA